MDYFDVFMGWAIKWILGPVVILFILSLVIVPAYFGVHWFVHRNDEPNPWTCQAQVQTGTEYRMVGKIMTEVPVYRCLMMSRNDPQGLRLANDSAQIIVRPDFTIIQTDKPR